VNPLTITKVAIKKPTHGTCKYLVPTRKSEK
jgi:hypothetical protein